MALSNSQYESIMRVYNRTQLQKKHELDARVDEVYEKIPAVREMNDAIAAAAVKSAKELLAGDADAVKRLRGTIADLKEQRQVLMSAYGYPADYLEMQVFCLGSDGVSGCCGCSQPDERIPPVDDHCDCPAE